MTPTQFDNEVKSRLDDFMYDLAAENKSWLDIPEDGRRYALALYRTWNGQSDDDDEGTLEEMWRSARQEYLTESAEANREFFEESRSEI
jgi:hypothetical protein